MARERQQELRRRRVRKESLALLRQRYLAATDDKARNHVWEKVGRIAPWLSRDGFLLSTTKE